MYLKKIQYSNKAYEPGPSSVDVIYSKSTLNSINEFNVLLATCNCYNFE